MTDNTSLRVYASAVLGLASPITNLFTANLEPILRVILLVGQVGVAGATIVYIIAKCRKLWKSKK